jgi:hypothetical protein
MEVLEICMLRFEGCQQKRRMYERTGASRQLPGTRPDLPSARKVINATLERCECPPSSALAHRESIALPASQSRPDSLWIEDPIPSLPQIPLPGTLGEESEV